MLHRLRYPIYIPPLVARSSSPELYASTAVKKEETEVYSSLLGVKKRAI